VECSGSYAKGKASWKALLLSGRVEKPWEAPQRSGGGKYCGRFFEKVFFFGVNGTRGVQHMQGNVLRTLGMYGTPVARHREGQATIVTEQWHEASSRSCRRT
jgi:hypothetical protein